MNLVKLDRTTYPDGTVVEHNDNVWTEPRPITKVAFLRWKLYIVSLLK